MKSFFKGIHIYIIALSIIFFISSAYALTLDEAISLAKENLPSYKASLIKVKSTEALHDASLAPYLPSLDASASLKNHYTSQENFDSRIYDLTLSYTLFDGGKRKANRNIALLNLDVDREELKKSLLDLEFNVKVAFYTAVAQKEIVEQRKIQLRDAEKGYEVAEGRHKFGVARLSDVLQASVRREQAKFNLIQSEGDYKKALAELNSLIGKALDSQYELIGFLYAEVRLPERNRLYNAVLQRPEIKQAESSLKISESNSSLVRSTFYPNISLIASYSYIKTNRELRTFASSSEEKNAGITATWNIFELGKFFRQKSSELEKDVSLEKLNDLKRSLLLDVHKIYEDIVTASNKIKVAEQQLKQAEQNYSQAFGEYKVGKTDILSLVQAEGQLSNAREQLIGSKLDLILTKTLLERAAGIERLESLFIGD